MTVDDIVKRARTRLGDTNKTGWADAVLIDFVDQGQKDLCKTARVYKRIYFAGILNHVKKYPLPTDCFQVDRVEYKDIAMSVLSREDQDTRYLAKGLHIIKSDINMDVAEISEAFEELDNYARFAEGTYTDGIEESLTPATGVSAYSDAIGLSMDTPLGVLTGFYLTLSDEQFTPYGDISGFYNDIYLGLDGNTVLGVVTELDFTDPDRTTYGFLTSVDTKGVEGTYGICTDALDIDNYLKIYYSALPPTVNSLYDALVLKNIWEKALVHYVVGMARQDDNDEGNYQLGMAEMSHYDKEVAKAVKLSARSYSSTVSEIKTTQYRRI